MREHRSKSSQKSSFAVYFFNNLSYSHHNNVQKVLGKKYKNDCLPVDSHNTLIIRFLILYPFIFKCRLSTSFVSIKCYYNSLMYNSSIILFINYLC